MLTAEITNRSPFPETLISRRAVAAFLSMSDSGFAKLLDRGEGPPHLRIGRLIRFSPTTVKQWVAAQIEIKSQACAPRKPSFKPKATES